MKSTTSANRIDAEVNWSAIVWGSAFSRSAIGRGSTLRSRLSAWSWAIWRAVNASCRCLANSARSVNTIVPPTAMLSASITLVNHAGSGELVPRISPARPHARKTARNATYQRMPARTPPKTSAPIGARMPQMPTPVEPDETAERDHRQGRREQDVEQLDVQEQLEVSRPGEDRDRSDRDGEVHECEHSGRRPEREVEAAPHQRDRQDQHRHEHEERLADARLLVVAAVGADIGQTRDHGLEERPREVTGGGYTPRRPLDPKARMGSDAASAEQVIQET